MGCDIHLFVERRDNGKWITCDQWQIDEDDEEKRPRVDYKKSFYHDRNYDLFAILADVRNGRGFAGIKTGEGFSPISPPKGIPDDCCLEYRTAAEGYGEDGHSHSWLTVAEIMAFDWTQTSALQGVVEPREWAAWKLTGRPRGWPGMVAGSGVVHVSPEEMEKAAREVVTAQQGLWPIFHDKGELAEAISRSLGGASAHTTVTWTIPYYEAGAELLGSVLPRLWRLGAAEDVRICFFFDN